jgi:hypothetical protein
MSGSPDWTPQRPIYHQVKLRFKDYLSKKVHSNIVNQGQSIMIRADDQNDNELLDADWSATAIFVIAEYRTLRRPIWTARRLLFLCPN